MIPSLRPEKLVFESFLEVNLPHKLTVILFAKKNMFAKLDRKMLNSSKQHVRRVAFTSPGKIGRFCGISIGKGIISASSSVRTCFFRMDREDIGAEATASEIAGD